MYISLNGEWKVNHVPFKSEIGEILSDHFVPEGWLTAQVPEDIHTTLRREGFLRGHVYNKEEGEDAWVEERDWVYYKEFYISPEELGEGECQLTCQGLDTFCDLYLNGKLLGHGQNMFRTFRKEIGETIKRGDRNVLVIRFYSPSEYVKDMDEKGIFSITTSDRIFARKAQMNYSWDFCGRTVTCGIWKDIGIEMREGVRLAPYYLYTEALEDGRALVAVEAGADCPAGMELDGCCYRAELMLDGHMAAEAELACGTAGERRKLMLAVDGPKLWWPRPYGEQTLYDFRLTLMKDGQVLDEKRQKFGIRTIEIRKKQQPDGRSFQFAINGREIFVRGANWVPSRMIYTDIRREETAYLLDRAAKGNLSMLRIWGGGIYADPSMYELCDELGILLWNDFMFACGIYPQDEAFLENVKEEAEEVICRYRNYTCLAVWAGDNENGQAYGWAGRDYEFQKDKISNQVLKEACARLDPHRHYLPTSPCSPDEEYKGGDNPSSPYQGDQHIYIMSADPGVNAYRDYGKNYYKRILGFRPRFMSEFGFISLPEKDTYYRYNFRRERLRHPEELIKLLPSCKKYLEAADMDRAIYYSQLFHSMALKYWIEYFRSLKGTCEGTLYWKFNDPLADSPEDYMFPSHMCSIDMYGNTKMAYYYTRRAYEDFLLLSVEEGEGRRVYAVNELLQGKKGTLVAERKDFYGTSLWKQEWDCFAGEDAATQLAVLSAEECHTERPFQEYLKLTFLTEEGSYENRYYYADINEDDRIELPAARLQTEGRRSGKNELTVCLHADRFARNVRMNLLDVRADYSDNYFDMDAGSTKEIRIQLPAHLTWRELAAKTLYVEAQNQERFVLPLCRMREG